MPKYLFRANLGAEATRGVVKEGGTPRRVAIEKAAQSVGGSLEAFYFAFGESDVYAISDLPDNTAAAALSLAINSSGIVTVSVTVLITPEELDQAATIPAAFRGPGQ